VLRAHLDGLDSAASAMFNSSMVYGINYETKIFGHEIDMEDIMGIVGIITTAANSIWSDVNKVPKPTKVTIVGNAIVAVSIQIASSFISDQVKDKLNQIENFNEFSATQVITEIVQQYVTTFIAEVLVGFDVKSINGLVKLLSIGNPLDEYI
jgi:hypothetical protein